MKKTLVKIFGVAVVIALLVSMLVAVVPTSALTYGSTAVALSSSTISSNSSYTITFAVGLNLTINQEIVVTFPYDTTVPAEIAAFPANSVTLNGTDVSGATTAGAASRIATIHIPAAINVGTINTLVFNTQALIYNPSSPGSYSIAIATADAVGNPIEAAVSSPTYTIGLLTAVNVYNQAGNLIASPSNLQDALNLVQNNYTVKLGAATYSLNNFTPTPTGDFTLNGNFSNVTITSADGNAADTIIGKVYPSSSISTFTINGSYITVSNLTFNGMVTNNATNATFTKCVFNQRGGSTENTLFNNAGNYLTLTNNSFNTTANGGNTGGPTVAVNVTDTVAPTVLANDSITVNTFNIGENASLQQDIAIQAGGPAGPSIVNVAVAANTFTGTNGGIGFEDGPSAVQAITNNTFTGIQTALDVSHSAGATPEVVVFQNNTVTKCITQASPNYTGAIQIANAGSTNITVTGNSITNNAGYSMMIKNLPSAAFANPPGLMPPGTAYAISGNTFSGNAQGFYTIANVANLSYANNYWGSATGIGTTSSDMLATNSTNTTPTTFIPFLGAASARAAVLGAGGTANGALVNTAVPAIPSMVAGIVVSSFYEGTAGNYLLLSNLGPTNPTTVAPPANAINYYDVYTNDSSFNNNNQLMQINFYATGITSGSNMYYYNAGTGQWVYCSNQGAAGTGGYVYVNVGTATANNNVVTNPAPSGLNGTSFVMVQGVAAPPASVTIQSPSAANGLTTGLTNILFSWNPVNTATGYSIVVSPNPDYSTPTLPATTVNGTAYVLAGPLTAGAYYFQITALQGTTVLAQGSGVFNAITPTTSASSGVTVTSTQVTETTTVTTTNVTTTSTQVVITQPAAVTPAWIWGIIGIGAILIIVVIVLIVRTRRTV